MSMHELVQDGVRLCNASVHLAACYANHTMPNDLWLLIEVVFNAKKQQILWRAAGLDKLNLEQKVHGCICVDKNNKSTRRRITTYLRSQLSRPDLLHGIYIEQIGWVQFDSDFCFVIGNSAPQPSALLAAGSAPPWIAAARVTQLQFAVMPDLNLTNATENLMQVMIDRFEVYLPVWGFSLFSMMRSFLQSYGKTTMAKRLCQLLNDHNGMIADIYDAGSSAVSMRNILMQARDRSMLFDDVFIGTNKAKQRERPNTAATLLAICSKRNTVDQNGRRA